MNAADAIALVWQSTLLLSLGALAALAHRARPARAHHALLLAAVMTLGVPALALGVGALGWGLLPAPSEPPAAAPVALPNATRESEPPSIPLELPVVSVAPASASTGSTSTSSPAARIAPPAALVGTEFSLSSLPWRGVALAVWGAASLLAALRLAMSWRQARRLVATSRDSAAPALNDALVRAAEFLGLARQPRLAESDDVASPLLWPWAGDGIVLVPTGAATHCRVDWDAIFTHELAHLRRRDHRGLLVSNLLVIALPWQPLAWWCRRQIARLADLACDDWVLAAGHPRADYAGALLALVPVHGRAWAQAAVSNGGTLRGRIQRILESGRAAPLVGRGWSWAAGALALHVALALACAQPGESAHEHAAQEQAVAEKPGASIEGVVTDSSGQPREGITVRAALSGEDGYEIRQTTTTDHSGRFRFEALQGDRWWSFSVDDPDFARQWIREVERKLPENSSMSVELVVQPPQTLSGTVRNEDGQPVGDVRVTLTREFPNDEKTPLQGHGDQDLAVTTTDAEGRFTLERLRPGWVSLMLDHPDYARAFTGMPRPKAGERDVELVIQRGLTLSGRVTSHGEPVPDAKIEAQTPNLSGRPIGEWDVRTDADGRFELRGVSTMLSRTRSTSGFPLVTLSVADEGWSSSRYQVFDEGVSELPVVEIEAVVREDGVPSVDTPVIAVNRAGSRAFISGAPSGTASLQLTVRTPGRTLNGQPREVWITGPASNPANVPVRKPIGDDGTLLFDHLAAGDYEVWCPPLGSPNFPTAQVSVAEGKSREFVLEPGPARVHGKIICGGQPVTKGAFDVNLFEPVVSSGFLQGVGSVNADGTWEVSGLPFGRYRLTYDNYVGGHSVPNYFVVDLEQPDTQFDLELPQTRVDVVVYGRDYRPPNFDQLDANTDATVGYDLRAYPGGTVPMGGNTGGIISVADGKPFVEHLPPGRWTLFTGSGEGGHEGRLVARVVLDSDTAHVTAELRPNTDGTAMISGRLLGFQPDKDAPDRWIDIAAYPLDDAGLDVTTSYGKVTIDHDRFRVARLPAGRYALLVGTDAPQPNGRCVAPLYVPGIVVADGEQVQRDLELQPGRLVKLQARVGGEPTYLATWRVDLGGGDWLPFHLFIGSSPRANVTGPSAFTLPLGDRRFEVTFRGDEPRVRTIRVEPGEGAQEIVIDR